MIRCLAAALLLTPVASAPAHAAPSGAARTATVGRYSYRDKELVGHLELRSDGTFTYQVDGIGPPVEGEGPFHLMYEGLWREGEPGEVLLTNAPTTPPRFVQTAATRDPSVRGALSVVAADGGATEDLGVLENGGENGALNMIADGRWTVPLLNAWAGKGGRREPTVLPKSWSVVRASDDRMLATVALVPGGPNRFAFRYTRGPIAPFQLAARLVEGEPGAIEIEFGTASITMTRGTK